MTANRPARPRKVARPGPSRGEPGRLNGAHLRLYRAYTERMAELIRSDALGHRDGFLAGLLDQWEQAKDWRTCWGEGQRDAGEAPGLLTTASLNIVEAFCQVASWELRRAICGTTPDDPPEDQAACARIRNSLVVSLPFQFYPHPTDAFLIHELPPVPSQDCPS